MRIRSIPAGACLLLCIALAATGALAAPAAPALPATEPMMRYTLYIGLNDPVAYTPVMAPEVARELADGICARHVSGFTSLLAQGGWLDDAGILTYEDTLVYILYGATEEQVASILAEITEALNQSAVLVEVAEADILFYSR